MFSFYWNWINTNGVVPVLSGRKTIKSSKAVMQFVHFTLYQVKMYDSVALERGKNSVFFRTYVAIIKKCNTFCTHFARILPVMVRARLHFHFNDVIRTGGKLEHHFFSLHKTSIYTNWQASKWTITVELKTQIKRKFDAKWFMFESLKNHTHTIAHSRSRYPFK